MNKIFRCLWKKQPKFYCLPLCIDKFLYLGVYAQLNDTKPLARKYFDVLQKILQDYNVLSSGTLTLYQKKVSDEEVMKAFQLIISRRGQTLI